MRVALQIISLVALALTVLPAIAYVYGAMQLGLVKWLLLLATIVWFVATPFWMDRKEGS